jgi:hypothetical protein
MSYNRYPLDISSAIYEEMEKLRKSYIGEKMKKEQALYLLKCMGLPHESPKMWELAIKYEFIIQKGSKRYTYYMVPLDPYSYKTLQKLQLEYYNGKLPKKEKEKREKTKDEITGLTRLTPEFCINFLKTKGYAVFKLSPNLVALQKKFTIEFLMESMNAELM